MALWRKKVREEKATHIAFTAIASTYSPLPLYSLFS